MTFGQGDPVHVAALGKGIVREVRNSGRYLVDIRGRAIVVDGARLTPADAARPPRRAPTTDRRHLPAVGTATASASIDLHGQTVDEALDAVGVFLNAALLAGHAEVRIIHGRSGGRLKAAVHARLKILPSIRAYGLDPRNPGVTIVSL